MNERQFKALVRFTFSLQSTADKTVLAVDPVLGRVMSQIKRLVETLPEEGLLRNRSWKQLEGLVKQQISEYTGQFGQSLVGGLQRATEGMEDYAIREATAAGADMGTRPVRLGQQGTPTGTALALKASVNGSSIKRLFNLDGRSQEGAINKALFRTIDKRVRTGFLNGTPTSEIADLMATDVTVSGVRGVRLTAPVAKQIRGQAMAVARTATQDMAREVKEEVYKANADALGGLVWEWEAALDSRTCPTCMPLDQQRWAEGDSSRPDWPLHPNCRCQTVLIDPEDEAFANQERTGIQIRPEKEGAYKGDLKTGVYKTPVKVNGQEFYRRTVKFDSDTPPPRYSDLLAKWANTSNTSLVEAFGGGSPGEKRARYFKRELDRFNKDPQQILESMLRGRPGEQQWIPLAKLKRQR